MTEPSQSWRLATPEDTEALAARFAAAWSALAQQSHTPPLGRACRVGLRGELGAGKTTWVRGFVRALGVDSPVQSPSYTLLQTFAVGDLLVVHADFYRLSNSADIDSLALDDLDRPQTVWLIEWPDRAGRRLGVWDLALEFQVEAAAHRVVAQAATEVGKLWLSQVLD